MRRIVFVLAVVLALCAAGCDSNVLGPVAKDDTREADIEEARMAIDDGDYDEAIAILLPHLSATDPDARVAEPLASAYMGRAGLDVTYLIENIDDDGLDSDFDVVASALAMRIVSMDGARFLSTGEEIDDMLDDLEQAVAVMDSLWSSTGDYDHAVQRGLASALHFVALAGSFVESTVPPSSAGLQGLAPVNGQAYRLYFADAAEREAYLDGLAAALARRTEILEGMRRDLVNVNDAVNALIDRIGADEDMTEDLGGFLRGILGLSGSGKLTEQDVRASFDAERLPAYIRGEFLGIL
ncbi:MAG TPA: hypothetical protein PLS81_09900 [Deltaproteobacteria bacterium]|nr:hypothetical protein [Deltaproteobacteria bacterium]HOM29753.1 hypothetical protein [Deltaproteobacteria bacterium]HPP81540.1 hypothetical protein [Deltaproteobacteria bacterium]